MRANGRTIHVILKTVVAFILLFVSTSAPALAQAAPATDQTLDAALSPGSTVWITDSKGQEQKARIVELAGDTVRTIADERPRSFRTQEITKVRARKFDSVLNGALIGAGSAVAAGLMFCRLTEPWENCIDDAGPMARIGALGAAIGIGIDALFNGRKTIFDRAHASMRLHAAPIVAPQAGGVRIAVTF